MLSPLSAYVRDWSINLSKYKFKEINVLCVHHTANMTIKIEEPEEDVHSAESNFPVSGMSKVDTS